MRLEYDMKAKIDIFVYRFTQNDDDRWYYRCNAQCTNVLIIFWMQLNLFNTFMLNTQGVVVLWQLSIIFNCFFEITVWWGLFFWGSRFSVYPKNLNNFEWIYWRISIRFDINNENEKKKKRPPTSTAIFQLQIQLSIKFDRCCTTTIWELRAWLFLVRARTNSEPKYSSLWLKIFHVTDYRFS